MRNIEVVLYRENEAWVAQALNVDVSSFGDTREEARAAIQEALELYFEDEENREIIEVSSVSVKYLDKYAPHERFRLCWTTIPC